MSDEKAPSGLKNKISRKKYAKPSLLGAAFLVLIAVAFGVFLLLGSDTNNGSNNEDRGAVVFKINDENFYQKDIDELIKYPVEKGKMLPDEAVGVAFENYKTIVTAKKVGIKIPKDKIDQVKNSLVTEEIKAYSEYQAKYDKWFDLIAEKQAIDEVVTSGAGTGYKGYAFVFYAGQHIQFGDDYKPEGLDDANLIKQDNEYAKQKAEEYHDKLKKNEISAQDLDAAIKADPKLKNFINASNPFGSDPEQNWGEQVFYPSVIAEIKKTTAKGVSDIKVLTESPGAEKSPVEMGYFFFVLDQAPTAEAASIDKFLYEMANIKTDYSDPYSKAITDAIQKKNDEPAGQVQQTAPAPANGGDQ